MLNTPAPFPFAGSSAFIPADDGAGDPQPCRILRWNPALPLGEDTALIALTGKTYPGERASGNRTVPASALFERWADAIIPLTLSLSKGKRRAARKAAK